MAESATRVEAAMVPVHPGRARGLRVRAWLLWLHGMAGVGAAGVLAIVGATGVILAFESELARATHPTLPASAALDARGVLPLPELAAALQAIEPERRLHTVELSGDPTAPVRIAWLPERSGGSGPARPGPDDRAFVDPRSGEVLARGDAGDAFIRDVRALHRWLVVAGYGDRDVGRSVTAICVWLCVLLALSGVYLHWPRRGGLLAALRWPTRLRGRAFWRGAHAVAGMWAMPLIVVMSLTGFYWSHDGYRAALHALAGDPIERRGETRAERPRGGDHSTEAATPLDLAAAWSTFQQATAADGVAFARWDLSGARGAAARVRYLDAAAPHDRAWNEITIEVSTGNVVEHARFSDHPWAVRQVRSMLALHSGSAFGMPGRIAYAVASLVLAGLSASGVWLYVHARIRRRRRATPPAPSQASVAGAPAALNLARREIAP